MVILAGCISLYAYLHVTWTCKAEVAHNMFLKVLSSVLLFQQERTDQTNGSEEGWHTSAPRTSYPRVQPTTQQWLRLRLNWSSPKPYRHRCWWLTVSLTNCSLHKAILQLLFVARGACLSNWDIYGEVHIEQREKKQKSGCDQTSKVM